MAPTLLRHLLDTNILVHLIRRNLLGQWIELNYSLAGTGPVPLVSSVTEGELRSLALQFAWGADKRRDLQDRLDRLAILPLDFPGVMEAYARIDHASRRMGRRMGKNDLWIAATAHATNARLLTTDQDFDHLNGIWLMRDWIDPASQP